MDDVRPDARCEPRERRRHPQAAHARDAQQRVDALHEVDVQSLDLRGVRVLAARDDVHLVPALGQPARPAEEVERLGVADPEQPQALLSHRRLRA